MSHKVLLAYAGIGSGHEQAARALGEEFDRIGWETSYVDFLDEVPAPMRFVMRDAYLQLLKILPQAYDMAFRRTVTLDLKDAERTTRMLSNIGYRKLRDLALAEKPDAIICTNLWPTLAFAKVKQHWLPDTLLINCFTDYVLQTLYMSKGVSWHVSANEDLTSRFLAAHRRLHVPIYPFGIPVRMAFAAQHSRQEARALLGIPQDVRLALVMGGGLGLGHITEVCDILTSTPLQGTVTVIALCGRNTDVQEQVRTLAIARSPVHTIQAAGWTDQVPVYMQAADLLVSKAGGVTLAEAAAIGVPLLIYNPLPGQEAVNALFLTARNAAQSADTTDQLVAAAENLLFTEKGRETADNLHRLGKPGAVHDIVAKVCAQTTRHEGTRKKHG